ncbi:MAG: TraB/GumN family protein [Myxococcota bacterium]|nr:TraB/GumN family protein [Myxococcota bacterium]
MELGPNVTVVEDGEQTLFIIGTAHISQRSVDEVRATIEAVQPDTVCVELCQTRYESITDDERWKKLNIFQVIREKKVLFLLANLALASYQRKLGEKLGVKPGAELVEAIKAANDVNAELVLADRDIQATLKRTWSNLSFFNRLKVLSGLTEGVFSREELTEDDLDALKDKDNISEMMKAFAKALPQVKEPLIDERDQFLMSAVQEAPGLKKVAVVGAGHVEGMLLQKGKVVDREALSVIPPGAKWVGLLKWVIPAIILCAFYFGYQKHAGTGLYELVLAWMLPNSIAAGLLCLIGGAKPLSILSAVVASPITSLNPTIGAGMVVGLVEAWLRKPTVEDAQRLSEDATSIRGLYSNAFSRVLIVALLATVGSAIGAYVGVYFVVDRL